MDYEMEKRVSVLETGMTWAQSNIQDIKRDLEGLKQGQLHLLEKIGDLQAHTDVKFIAVHQEIAVVHKEIAGVHRAISTQTKWILAVILGAATLASVVQPLMMKLL